MQIQTIFKIILDENDKLTKVIEEVGRKIGEPNLNLKNFIILPVNKFSTA